MTSRLRLSGPDRTALVDQVLAILRDASPLPVGTHDIGLALGPYRPVGTDTIRCHCGHEHQHTWTAPYERNYHPAGLFVPRLRTLAKRGVVERIPKVSGRRMDATGQDYWRWLGEPE